MHVEIKARIRVTLGGNGGTVVIVRFLDNTSGVGSRQARIAKGKINIQKC